jgi:hypothetical protein
MCLGQFSALTFQVSEGVFFLQASRLFDFRDPAWHLFEKIDRLPFIAGFEPREDYSYLALYVGFFAREIDSNKVLWRPGGSAWNGAVCATVAIASDFTIYLFLLLKCNPTFVILRFKITV